MHKQYWLGLVVGLMSGPAALAQDFQSEFRTAFQRDDTVAVGQVLRRWQQARPQDPNWFVARFNYLFKQAEIVELRSGTTAEPGALQVKDKKGRVVASMGSGFRPDFTDRACATLRQGLQVAPNRLDMWFGLAKAYEMTGQPTEQVRALTEALTIHAKSPTIWLWRDGAALPAPEAEFVPGSLEEYASYYWRRGDDTGLETGRQIAELLVQYYPQSSLGYFNLGAYHGFKGQHQQAYDYLQRADKLQPDDVSTVANLTKLAIDLKRKPEAQQYLARLQKMPDGREAVTDFAPLVKKMK